MKRHYLTGLSCLLAASLLLYACQKEVSPSKSSASLSASTTNAATGEKVALTKKEAMLLKLLIENKNEVVTREKILQSVWGYNVYPTTRTVDNFILSFRKYFEEDSRNPKFFHSIRGIGYKFTDN